MSSDAASQSESESDEINEVDAVTLMWRRLTEGYKFEDGISHDTLTEQFAIDDEDVAQAVCSEAFSYVMDDGRTRFELGDFEQAVEAVRSEPEDDDQESGEDAVDEGREKDIEVDTDGKQTMTNADRAGTVEQDSSAIERDAVDTHDDQAGVETVEVPRKEFERLQVRVARLENFINRDFALLKGSMRRLLGVEEQAGLEDLPGYAAEFSDEHDSVLTHARKGTDVADGGENLSKIELALTIAKQESVRVSTKGIRGGAIDYPAVRDIADRQYETELNSGTVYTAFDRLARQYECFHVTDGEQGPNSKNKQLRADRDEIPRALLSDGSMEG